MDTQGYILWIFRAILYGYSKLYYMDTQGYIIWILRVILYGYSGLYYMDIQGYILWILRVTRRFTPYEYWGLCEGL